MYWFWPTAIAVAFAALWGVIALFKYLWNITIPDIFGLETITYWQTFRLLIIATLLFGGLAR